ncbi:hypothetical protein F511_10601 [Dorcoceras hygrometricum]|uniref:Uncharacterized protein n=1 Tax=Dorcoceras hygrometricum TaxID=472368 RepID=A0A2Z7CNY0_9LAMI|nr:hypothetical protein F511_10601 [Dorcoceras hygrometricum]
MDFSTIGFSSSRQSEQVGTRRWRGGARWCRRRREVYQQSIAAVCSLDWPKGRMLIQVLDDSDDPTTQLLIKEEDINGSTVVPTSYTGIELLGMDTRLAILNLPWVVATLKITNWSSYLMLIFSLTRIVLALLILVVILFFRKSDLEKFRFVLGFLFSSFHENGRSMLVRFDYS